ncbi:MAG: YchF/TatD family DNA exonuclease [Magnetococcales bacterium]|nr:YchF/TatD family DNA exonuclease [Magnetococcales bacterium]
MMTFADSHAHLDFPDFAEDWRQVLHRAREAGVVYVNSIGTRLAALPRLLDMAGEEETLFVSVGVHPHGAGEGPVDVESLMAWCGHPKVVAVGETGLDYHYTYSPRAAQEQVFRTHLRAAHRTGLPVVIHTREADADTRAIVAEEGVPAFGGVIHCFTGGAEMAQWALEQGFHISFSGILTFKNARELRQVAAGIPLERLLIETDSPYLTPVPGRGGRNDPSQVVKVARVLAEVTGRSLEEIAATTTENYLKLFRISRADRGRDREILAYPLGAALYLNVTRGCTLKCAFCPKWRAPVVHDYDLTLRSNPDARRLIEAMGDPTPYREVVFCGFGEPTLRLGVILEVARAIKRYGKPVRLNTDGLANLVHGRDVTPELAGLIDTVSISLNAQDQATYDRHCRPRLAGSYAAMLDFTRRVKAHVPQVTLTAIQGLDGVDIDACRRIAADLGVHFRVRYLDNVG